MVVTLKLSIVSYLLKRPSKNSFHWAAVHELDTSTASSLIVMGMVE